MRFEVMKALNLLTATILLGAVETNSLCVQVPRALGIRNGCAKTCPHFAHVVGTKSTKSKHHQEESSVDYVAVQQALGTYANKSPRSDLIPACTFSTTYGPDQERFMVDGSRVLYRNGFVNAETNEWVTSDTPPAPHMYNIDEGMKVVGVAETDEKPPMIVDGNGFPWRAEHVLEELGLRRSLMDPPELDTREFEPGAVTAFPNHWEGPLPTSGLKKSTFSKKLKRDSRIGCELDDERWLVHYTKLVAFASKAGHADVPLMWAEDRSLGRWSLKQRVLYRKYARNDYYQHEILPGGKFGRKINTLSPWRIQMLYDVGFSFKIRLRWEERYAQLAQFYIQHGHARVPCSDTLDVTEEEFPGLYVWVQQQRTEYQRWQTGVSGASMSQERFDLLEKLSLDLEPLESSWRSHITQLRKFREDHGHVRVKKSQNFELATWLISQRKQFRLYNGSNAWDSSLTSRRINELNALGMDWDPLETKWQEQFSALEEFYGEHGHTNVPVSYLQNQSLSFWVQKQRRNFREGRLKPHHEKQLREINFVFDMHEDYYGRGLEKLRAYRDKNGNCLIESSCPDNDLLRFVQHLRNQFRNIENGQPSSLTSKRRQELDELGFVWTVQSTAWQEQYAKLLSFKLKFGHCDVPSNYTDSSLYNFVSVQRRNYKLFQLDNTKGLSPERIKMLEDIGFSFNTKVARWMRRYSELKNFLERHGHCNVSDTYDANPKLGVWVRNQRVQYRYLISGKRSTLTEDRVRMLKEIGFAWSIANKSRQ